MKQRLLAFALLIAAALACGALASAVSDPIECTITVSPQALPEPGEVSVTIAVSNTGDTDMTRPLTLYDPTSQVVKDFGENGSVTLKAGETKTWTGTWNVNQRTLENGQIVYFVQYTIVDGDGGAKKTSRPIRGEIVRSGNTAKLSVTRTIVPETACEGMTVNVIYDILNEGDVPVTNLALQENAYIFSQRLYIADQLKPGECAQVKLPVVMGREDLISRGVVTYAVAGGAEERMVALDERTIVCTKPALLAVLSAASARVMTNGTAVLTLELENAGDSDITGISVTDPVLGELFGNLSLLAGEKLTLQKEITLTQTADFQFHILGFDDAGTETGFLSNVLTLIAVDPDQVLNLKLTLSSNKMGVYSDREVVRFTVVILNSGNVDAADITVYHGNTLITAFSLIPAGESRKFSRDVTLSMPGKYQFRAEAADAFGNAQSFESNGLQIAFLEPTPAPATPEPVMAAIPAPSSAVNATAPSETIDTAALKPRFLQSFLRGLMIAAIKVTVAAFIVPF